MDRAWVLEELRANLERHKETNGAVANRALELIGKELGLFINRKDITVRKDDLDDLSGKELALEYARTAQLLLESYARDEEEDKGPVSRGMPMKAAFIERHGGPEVPKFGEMPDPVAASGEVVVDITLLVGR